MKKQIIIISLTILVYTVLVSCSSCTSGSAQTNNTQLSYIKDSAISQDTIKNKNLAEKDTIRIIVVSDSKNVKSQKLKTVFKKEIKPMEIDTIRKIDRDSNYKKLKKTEVTLNMQYKQMDSLLLVKRK